MINLNTIRVGPETHADTIRLDCDWSALLWITIGLSETYLNQLESRLDKNSLGRHSSPNLEKIGDRLRLKSKVRPD